MSFSTDKNTSSKKKSNTILIFGANGSGKTNILLALEYLRQLTIGHKSEFLSFANERRLKGNVSSKKNNDCTTEFELSMVTDDYKHILTYFLKYDSSEKKVIKEHYSMRANNTKLDSVNEIVLFTRVSNNIISEYRIDNELRSNHSEIISNRNDDENFAKDFLREYGCFYQTDYSKTIGATRFPDDETTLSSFRVNGCYHLLPLYYTVEEICIISTNDYDRKYSTFGINGLLDISRYLNKLTGSDLLLPDDGVEWDEESITFAKPTLDNDKIQLTKNESSKKESSELLFREAYSRFPVKLSQLSSGTIRLIDLLFRIRACNIWDDDYFLHYEDDVVEGYNIAQFLDYYQKNPEMLRKPITDEKDKFTLELVVDHYYNHLNLLIDESISDELSSYIIDAIINRYNERSMWIKNQSGGDYLTIDNSLIDYYSNHLFELKMMIEEQKRIIASIEKKVGKKLDMGAKDRQSGVRGDTSITFKEYDLDDVFSKTYYESLPFIEKKEIEKRKTKLVAIDEFAYSLHPSLARKVILCLKELCPNCQYIMTTHNTGLISGDETGFEKICFVTKLEGKTRVNSIDNNDGKINGLKIDYLEGRFDGIPLMKRGY